MESVTRGRTSVSPLPLRWGLVLGLLAIPVFGAACAVSVTPPADGPTPLLLALKIEEARGHLVVAVENARAGRLDLAKLHAAHPVAEALPAIESALQPQHAELAARLRRALTDNLDPAGLAALEASVARIEAVLAEARGALVTPALAADLAFQGSLVAALLDAAAAEYAEALDGGVVRNEAEYQDGYGFFRRGLALWSGFEDGVKARAPHEYGEIEEQLQYLRTAFPAVSAPARPVQAGQVEEWAAKAQAELAEATGFTEGAALVSAGSAAEAVKALTGQLDQVDAALVVVDAGAARQRYREFHEGWGRIEDGVRASSRDAYRRIEEALGDLNASLEAQPFAAGPARAALARVNAEMDAFAAGQGIAASGSPTSGEAVTLTGQVARLDRALERLAAGDSAAAAAEVAGFRRDWIEVEGLVKAKSAQAYADTENNMAKAYALLTRTPVDAAAARDTLGLMREDLAPFAQGDARYGVFDATIILLREGMEALLVVVALLAFLNKTGHADKGRWIWAGSGAGVGASVLVALAVNLLFARAAAGANRELLEGLTGLAAAIMLVYVSYWLHSKSSLTGWQRYVHDKSVAALARNSLLSLALISFLAVFREGAETVLFYLGIAPSIALADLALGLALGAVGLVAAGVLILAFGVRVPIRPFFLGTSVLLYYLAFKFVGTGIHALQVAGVLGATPGGLLPENGFFGIYPTYETTLVQVALLMGAALVLLVQRARTARTAAAR